MATTYPRVTNSINDPTRLEALERSGLLRRDERTRFDILCESAAALLLVPIAQLNVLNGEDQFSIGKYPDDEDRITAIQDTGCQHVITADAPVLIPNTLLHPVMCVTPIVTVAGVRSYLGVPVYYDDQPIGSFCVADYSVRDWKHWDVVGLQGLARLAGLAVDR